MRRIEEVFATNKMPPLLPVQQIFALPNPPTDPIINIAELDRKATDLLALKHPLSQDTEPPFVDPLTFASLTFHHAKAIFTLNNLPEEYFVPLYYGHLTAAWTNENELKIGSFQEAQSFEKQYQIQICSLLRRFPPTLDEVKYVGQSFLSLTEGKETKKVLAMFRAYKLFHFPIKLLTENEQIHETHEFNSNLDNNLEFKGYRIELTTADPQYVERIWSRLTIEELVAFFRVHALANQQLMKSYLVGSFLTMIFATASDNMSANWYEKRFNTLCSLFPDLFIKVVMSTDIIEKYSKLYLRQEIGQEAIFTAFLYSASLTKDFITENKLSWIMSQIHTNSVRAALGLAELVLTNRFLTHSFLSQHIPADQFKAIGVLVMEIYRDPFASIVISSRKALRYLYPDLAYLGISASSHFSLYPCRPLGTAVNTKEALDNLMAAIKEISMEIEGARMLQMETASPQIQEDLSSEVRRQQLNPYEAWEQYITKNMTPKDHAFASMMNNLLNTCRTSIIELMRNGGWEKSRKQVINQDFREKLELFDITVPQEYMQPETPPFTWNLNFENLPSSF